MSNQSSKDQPFNSKFLIVFTLLLVNCFSSAQASTDTTSISVSVVVKAAKSPCQLSLGGKLNESSNNCQLNEFEFAQKIALHPINNHKQIVTQTDGNLSLRVSITAP